MKPPSPSLVVDALQNTRMNKAEQRGLKLAIFCRTIVIAFALLWLVTSGYDIRYWTIVALGGYTFIGAIHYLLVGTSWDRWWMKYSIYAADVLGICSMFVLIPVSRADDVPQIIAFRAYGIYYLFPIIAMACLSLSWRLVLWVGVISVVGWWVAFMVVISSMETQTDWGAIPPNATVENYRDFFLSFDFIGTGSRVEETGLLFLAAMVLSLSVYRARQVFFSQVHAEHEHLKERDARERTARAFGRYVPETLINDLVEREGALEPTEREAAVLTVDIVGFSSFANQRKPLEVITTLDRFLSASADIVGNHCGAIISYTGDGFLSAFNVPIELSDYEDAAIGAALDLIEMSKEGGFSIRLGVACGPVAAGVVGSSERQAFTIYGDAVNRSARLEQLCKETGFQLLADATLRRDNLDWQVLGDVHLRGMSLGTDLVGLKPIV